MPGIVTRENASVLPALSHIARTRILVLRFIVSSARMAIFYDIWECLSSSIHIKGAPPQRFLLTILQN